MDKKYVMDYTSVMRKKEILPFATKLAGLSLRALCEVKCQIKTNTVWFHLFVESQKTQPVKTDSRMNGG